MESTILYEDVFKGGCHWSMTMRRGTGLRFIDNDGGANVGLLFFNPSNTLERYNAPDTLKCQHTFKLHRGHCLYSDMGRIFCSIVEDSVGWHETVCGNLTRDVMHARWGEHNYQDFHNEFYQSGHDSFLVELAKYGLGVRDMGACVNLFSKVSVEDNGDMVFDPHNSSAGDFVELRFEMDTLVLLHTCPHPMNEAADFPRRSVSYQIRQHQAVADDDFCKQYCEENQRGFENNRIYHLGA